MFDWITGFLETGGLFAVAAIMFLENVFPPIPSELIMPLAGYNASQGVGSLWATILAGSFGAVAGALFWYWIAMVYGMPRLQRLAAKHGRWLTVTPADLDRADAWFHRFGGVAVLAGRCVPTIRTLISIPAGLSRMPLPWFLLLTSIGTVIWTAGLTIAGYLLGANFAQVEEWLSPFSTIVILLIVGIYIYRVVTFKG